MALHSGLPFTLCFLQPGIGQGRRRRNGEQRMWRRGKEEKEEKGGGVIPGARSYLSPCKWFVK